MIRRILTIIAAATVVLGFVPLAMAYIYNPTSSSSGTTAIANGGTNATSFTTGQPIAFDGTRLISTSTLSIVYGGTGTSTQVTNGVSYYDGTKITSSATLLSFNGTSLGIASSSPSALLS